MPVKELVSWDINFRLLRIAKDKGHCLCDLSKTCPCDAFIDNQECKCGVYTVHKDIFEDINKILSEEDDDE